MKLLPVLLLRGYLCVAVSLCTLCDQWLWWEGWIQSEHSPVFPQFVLAAILWWEVGPEMEGLESELGVSWGLSYAQRLTAPCQGQGWSRVLEQKL